MTKRTFSILVFALGVAGLIAVFFAPRLVPAYYSWWGRLLYEWNLWVVDRGFAVGPEVRFTELICTIVTFVVLLPALFIILSKRYVRADKKWAYGAVGTILAAWLKVIV